jgi:hypothetical protein
LTTKGTHPTEGAFAVQSTAVQTTKPVKIAAISEGHEVEKHLVSSQQVMQGMIT